MIQANRIESAFEYFMRDLDTLINELGRPINFSRLCNCNLVFPESFSCKSRANATIARTFFPLLHHVISFFFVYKTPLRHNEILARNIQAAEAVFFVNTLAIAGLLTQTADSIEKAH